MVRNHVVTIRVSDDELRQIDDVLGKMKSFEASGAGAEETNEAIRGLTRADAFRAALMGKRGEVSLADLNLQPVLVEIAMALRELEILGQTQWDGGARVQIITALETAQEHVRERQQRASMLDRGAA